MVAPFAFSLAAVTQPFNDSNELLAQAARDFEAPGLAAAAVVDGKVAHVAAHGWRDVERQLPMTVDTPSRWYSISKPLTAIALARLVGAGKLRWDQRVAELAPGARFADPVATERATITDCLLHRTGLISGDWTWFGAPSDPAELLKRLPHVPCRPGFRAGHFYQNLNFTILGEVFKAVGIDWHQAMRDLLEPLGVRPLTRLSEFVEAERAVGYGPGNLAPPVRMEDFDFEAIAPASAVCGSITELAQVARVVALSGRDVLPPKLWNEVTRPVQSSGTPEWPEMQMPCGALAGRALVYRGEIAMQWAGGFRGYTSNLVALPGRKAAACALSTRSSSPAAEALAWSMLDRAAGLEPLPWIDRLAAQKRRFRRSGEERLAAQLAKPAAPWPATEVAGEFEHPAYGTLAVVDAKGGPRLQFRTVDLPLTPRPDGSITAEGSSVDTAEIFWTLRPFITGCRVTAWDFNPDDATAPCRFERAE